MMGLRNSARQQGVAVVTALLLTTLAITIVASLFWQQQVQVRSIENQRLQLQKQWILRGALDWTRLILRTDASGPMSGVDHLGEPWATPLAETRLDQYVENASADGDASDAVLSGGIVDAQSRFNLTNLRLSGQSGQEEVVAFAKLLTNLRQNPALAKATATAMQAEQGAAASATDPSSVLGTAAATTATTTTASTGSDTSQPLNILYVDDLLAVPGFTPEVLEAIRDFVVVLPTPTLLNVNTAPAEVLAAKIATLSLADAAGAVATRETAWFKDTTDFEARVMQRKPTTGISTTTNYFLVNGNVRLNRATMRMQALVERNGTTTRVLWIRES